MGVLPLVLKDGMTMQDLDLKGGEIVNIAGWATSSRART